MKDYIKIMFFAKKYLKNKSFHIDFVDKKVTQIKYLDHNTSTTYFLADIESIFNIADTFKGELIDTSLNVSGRIFRKKDKENVNLSNWGKLTSDVFTKSIYFDSLFSYQVDGMNFPTIEVTAYNDNDLFYLYEQDLDTDSLFFQHYSYFKELINELYTECKARSAISENL